MIACGPWGDLLGVQAVSAAQYVAEETGQLLAESAGMQQEEAALECSPLLFVLHRESHDSFAMAVVNTGLGAEYNPLCPDPVHGGARVPFKGRGRGRCLSDGSSLMASLAAAHTVVSTSALCAPSGLAGHR